MRFPRGLCRQIVQATAPQTYVQHARNPAHDVQIGGDATVFAPNYGSPFVHDLDRGRRYATLEDFENFVKLAYVSPHLHHSGGTVCEPVDVPVSKRHLDMVYAHLRYSDKPFMGSVTAGSRAEDSFELARIAFGGDLGDRTVMTSLINASSPLVWDGSMLEAARVYAERNQATIITPFILAGAMAPTTSAAVAAQTLAEALAGMTFVQLVRPGAPVIFGSFASSMSMQTGAPTFGTPEPAVVLYTCAALARRFGVPFRSGGALTASKVPDAQAAYESASTLIPTLMGGVNFVLHAAGWLEGGLSDRVREVRHRRGPARDDGDVRPRPRSLGERPGDGRVPDPGAGCALPRRSPHAGQLRAGVLPVGDRRQFQLRAMERRRIGSMPRSARTRSGSDGSPTTSRPRSTTPSTRSCATSSPAGRPSSPTSSPDPAGSSLAAMDLQSALTYLRGGRQGVLITIRGDGRPQPSNIVYVVDDRDVIRISITAARAKAKNLARDPRAVLYVSRDDFWQYVAVDGTVELGPVVVDPHDAAADELVEVYRAVAGEHDDWDDYRAALVKDQRLVVRLTPTSAYGMLRS